MDAIRQRYLQFRDNRVVAQPAAFAETAMVNDCERSARERLYNLNLLQFSDSAFIFLESVLWVGQISEITRRIARTSRNRIHLILARTVTDASIKAPSRIGHIYIVIHISTDISLPISYSG